MIIIKPDKMGKKNKQGMPFQRLLKPCRQAYGGLLWLTSAGSSRNKNILGGEREVGAASSGIIITTNNIRVIGKGLRFYAANTNNSNPEMADKDDKKKNADEESSAAAIGGGGGGGGVKLNPQNYKVQSLVHADPSGGWEKCWEQGLAPWDLGQPTPVILHLHQTSALPKGRALVPGCGSGHDVIAIACPDRYVVGLDISNEAIKQAIEMSSSLPNANYFTFLTEDFFGWRPTELFDLIFDYTFFCAIEPEMRPAWARQVRDLLKYDGELITLIFPISDHVGGPPYKVSVSDYEEVLLPMGFEAVSIVDNELAVGARKGREKLGRWKKILNQSSL